MSLGFSVKVNTSVIYPQREFFSVFKFNCVLLFFGLEVFFTKV